MPTVIKAEHRDEFESLLETIESEGWQVEGYDVNAAAPTMYATVEIRRSEFTTRPD